MQLRKTGQKVTGNVDAGGEFKIKASGKAFKILTSNLYENKIKAIIRELSCNAWDAHIASGNIDTPFELHYPNRNEPWFGVKDFGIGIKKSKQKIIFDRFKQLDSGATKQHSGHGLGLCVIKDVLEILNGKISVSSKQDEGSNFTITLSEYKSEKELDVYAPEGNKFLFEKEV